MMALRTTLPTMLGLAIVAVPLIHSVTPMTRVELIVSLLTCLVASIPIGICILHRHAR